VVRVLFNGNEGLHVATFVFSGWCVCSSLFYFLLLVLLRARPSKTANSPGLLVEFAKSLPSWPSAVDVPHATAFYCFGNVAAVCIHLFQQPQSSELIRFVVLISEQQQR
jgi:hypothetical protein